MARRWKLAETARKQPRLGFRPGSTVTRADTIGRLWGSSFGWGGQSQPTFQKVKRALFFLFFFSPFSLFSSLRPSLSLLA